MFLQTATGSGLAGFLPLLAELIASEGDSMFVMAVLAVMYFFFLRPQMKRQKQEAKYRETLSKGMKVVTTSGIHGKIINLIDQTVVVESENSRLRFERSAISKEMSQKAYPENKS